MAAVIVAILYWSAIDTNISVGEFVRGIPAIVDYLGRMFPPDWAYAQDDREAHHRDDRDRDLGHGPGHRCSPSRWG